MPSRYAARPENRGRLPWAAPLCRALDADPALRGSEASGVLFGRVPDTPFLATGSDSGGAMQAGWPAGMPHRRREWRDDKPLALHVVERLEAPCLLFGGTREPTRQRHPCGLRCAHLPLRVERGRRRRRAGPSLRGAGGRPPASSRIRASVARRARRTRTRASGSRASTRTCGASTPTPPRRSAPWTSRYPQGPGAPSFNRVAALRHARPKRHCRCRPVRATAMVRTRWQTRLHAARSDAGDADPHDPRRPASSCPFPRRSRCAARRKRGASSTRRARPCSASPRRTAGCPAPPRATSRGEESFAPGGRRADGNCAAFHDGFLPAATIGLSPLDAEGFARDGWGTPANRVRYAVFGAGRPSAALPIPSRAPTACSRPPWRRWGMLRATS